MKRIACVITLLGVLLGHAATCARAQDGEPPPGQYRITRLPFEQLSERTVSRQGDAALAIKSIQWDHNETDHFIFHTETGFSVPQLVASAEWSYAEIKKDLGITQDSFERKCHVYVFLNEQAWHAFIGSSKMEPWTGGWCTGRELFFWSRPNFKFQGTTLPHEMTHLVLHRFMAGDIPLWLNEGLAEFEGIRLYRTYLKLRGYTLTNIRDHVDSAHYIALSDLTSAIDYPRNSDDVTAFYTESQRLIAFLYFQHGGISPLLRFTKLLTDGARFDTAWRDIYGSKYSDLPTFETKFRTFVTKQKD